MMIGIITTQCSAVSACGRSNKNGPPASWLITPYLISWYSVHLFIRLQFVEQVYLCVHSTSRIRT